MADGILNFYDKIKARELARDFQFRVVALGPLTADDLVYLRTATLPGKEIIDNVVPYMGLEFHVPGGTKYTGSEAWSVKFLADEAHNIRSKMEAWQSEIFSVETSTGKYGVPVEEATMDLLDKNFQPVRRYNFIGIYLRTLGPIEYDIKGGGAPREFDATFAYQFWRQQV